MNRILSIFMPTVMVSTAVFGQSRILYTLELGGDNQSALWESNELPPFIHGTTEQDRVVIQGEDLTWAVQVSVGGLHDREPGRWIAPLGAAHLAFDLELLEADGVTLVNIGAAVLECADGKSPGQDSQTFDCKPINAGFWSSINDGDADGTRVKTDPIANAAFARDIYNRNESDDPGDRTHYDPEPTCTLYNLLDPAPDGPGFDFGWYPTANYRGGIRINSQDVPDVSIYKSELVGRLAGFCAGYLDYDFTRYQPGVGVDCVDYDWNGVGSYDYYYGFGAFVDRLEEPSQDPINMPLGHLERALFEGQISTISMSPGTYILRVLPSEMGNNILHGYVLWDYPQADYQGWKVFASRADLTTAWPLLAPGEHGLRFEIVPPSTLEGRLFYNNSYYDGNNAAIDIRDFDAIDPSKSPLRVGGDVSMAEFSNWTGYNKGINGLIFDVAGSLRDPQQADFVFSAIGRLGTDSPVSVSPTGFEVHGDGGSKRVVVTFADGAVTNTWLRVEIGTGFGLREPEVHYWGNAIADGGVGNTPPYITVNAEDEVVVRNNPRTPANLAPVDFPYDYNKDSLVNSTDETLARDNIASAFNCVHMITR